MGSTQMFLAKLSCPELKLLLTQVLKRKYGLQTNREIPHEGLVADSEASCLSVVGEYQVSWTSGFVFPFLFMGIQKYYVKESVHSPISAWRVLGRV